MSSALAEARVAGTPGGEAAAPMTSAEQLPPLQSRLNTALPALAICAVGLVAIPLVGSLPVWVTLTLAGLSMGMLLFVMASGLTLVFGLMDVMNLGHASFVAVGAYVGVTLAEIGGAWLYGTSPTASLLALSLIWLGAAAAGAATGWLFEALFVRPVYGDHLKQILVTVGALLVFEQVILAIWGPRQMTLMLPDVFRGTLELGGVAIEKYRLLAVAVGMALYIALQLMFARTRLGLVIRAGVENREMVESLGYRIGQVFLLVFVAGAALAALGGAMWGFYREQFNSLIGADLLVQLLVVVIVGGLGSIRGCFVAAMLLALVQNYVSYLLPALALVSNVLVMVLVLLWRPTGLYAAGR